jgi:hypothetical protein
VIIIDFLFWLQEILPAPLVAPVASLVFAVAGIVVIYLFALLVAVFMSLVEKISGAGFLSKSRDNFSRKSRKKELRADLLVLLKNDVPTARRLLNGACHRYPGRTEIWYLEKVISDLERDRR